jgi:hypothetical protein
LTRAEEILRRAKADAEVALVAAEAQWKKQRAVLKKEVMSLREKVNGGGGGGSDAV